MLSQFSTFPVTLKLGTGYDYPDLPGLGNNNEKLGLAERLSTAKINQQQQYI
jgi:hypothetical protein